METLLATFPARKWYRPRPCARSAPATAAHDPAARHAAATVLGLLGGLGPVRPACRQGRARAGGAGGARRRVGRARRRRGDSRPADDGDAADADARAAGFAAGRPLGRAPPGRLSPGLRPRRGHERGRDRRRADADQPAGALGTSVRAGGRPDRRPGRAGPGRAGTGRRGGGRPPATRADRAYRPTAPGLRVRRHRRRSAAARDRDRADPDRAARGD